MTYVDELDLPDLLDQLHGGVAVDEEGLGVVAQLQRLQPLGHRRGVVAVVADGPYLRAAGGGGEEGKEESDETSGLCFYLETFYYFSAVLQDDIKSDSGVYFFFFFNISAYWLLGRFPRFIFPPRSHKHCEETVG